MNRLRRDLVGAAAWAAILPQALAAQPARMPRVLWAAPRGPQDSIRKVFSARGLEDGRNVRLVFETVRRMAQRPEIEANARRFVAGQPDVIVIVGEAAELFEIQRLTRTIPVVFANLNIDPQLVGLVESARRPGGNLTGTFSPWDVLVTKHLGLLLEVKPSMRLVGRLQIKEALEETSAGEAGWVRIWRLQEESVRNAAAASKVELREIVLPGSISAASMARAVRDSRVEGLLVEFAMTKGVFEYLRSCPLPACMYSPESARAGALMAVFDDWDEGLEQAVRMVVRILRGESPASMPVYQVTKYGIAVNLRTARANGIVIPPSVLVQATEVIE